MGKQAEQPYRIEKIGLQAYSVEELCFLICRNAYLLDEDFLDKKLTDWLKKECELETLAKTLQGMLRSGCSLADFIRTLLWETAYCTPEEIRSVEELLEKNAGLSGSERKKVHADYLVQNGRYTEALREYETLLEQLEDGEPLCLRIQHNMGVAFAGMQQFHKAAELFLGVYEKSGERDEIEAYLAALRMELPEEEYVRKVSERPEYTEALMELEKRYAQARSQWPASRTGEEWNRIIRNRQNGNSRDYYENMGAAIAGLKESYRKNMM